MRKILSGVFPYTFLIPALSILGLVSIYSVFFAFRLSFFSWKLGTPWSTADFVGFRNYFDIFQSGSFYKCLQVTLIFVGCSVVFEFAIALGLALLLEKPLRGLSIFRSLFILPMMISPVVVGLVWFCLYDPLFGMINYLLGEVGIGPKMWLASGSLALPSIIIADIWQWTPFCFLLLLAGLQTLPAEPMEAAIVDGASSFQVTTRIKLPLLRPVIGVVILLRLIDAFRVLVVVFLMTFGGPGRETEILSLHTYKMAFVSQRLGMGSSLAFILLAIVLVFAVVLICLTRMAEPEV